MQYAIMLYFDEDTSNKVKEYLLQLNDVTNNKYMLDEKMPAHITLAMWNSEYDYINEITEMAKESESFDISFSSLGMFNDEEKHIFLSPVKSNKLIELHNQVYNTLNLEDENDYIKIYKDDSVWVPHVTIGYQIKASNLSDALSRCTNIKFPIKARAIKLAYAICCPFKELAILELK